MFNRNTAPWKQSRPTVLDQIRKLSFFPSICLSRKYTSVPRPSMDCSCRDPPRYVAQARDVGRPKPQPAMGPPLGELFGYPAHISENIFSLSEGLIVLRSPMVVNEYLKISWSLDSGMPPPRSETLQRKGSFLKHYSSALT